MALLQPSSGGTHSAFPPSPFHERPSWHLLEHTGKLLTDDLSSSAEFNLRMMESASPSTQTSRNPISSAMITACKHALASAMTGSRIFSHEKVQAAITKPSLLRAITPEIDLFVFLLKDASKLIFMRSLSGGFQTREWTAFVF
ncbi:hypothetical protein J1N35_039082 [Gossypium stocksii]|uniref:Uncharacterized protein n=1 Tax=Gossypium stocksii TaxID=47602 RepID=A0A9D3UN39_9ROSI|nr:hypothetical protein J1N35_039082 [Gossypium stocksii]